MRPLAAGAVLLALVVAGCGSAHHASPTEERQWVAHAQRWLAVESFQGDFRDCAQRLHSAIGEPPAPALDSVERSLDGLCARFARAYADLHRAFATNNATLYFRSQKEEHAAEHDIAPVRGLVDAWSPRGNHRGLPVKGGITEVSRIEPRFSAAASAVAGFPVEIRCWSRTDWPRIKSVASAEGAGRPVVRDLGGLADPTADWADLSPEICDDLVNVTYRKVHNGVDAAVGLTVLAHEATHLRGDTATEAETECFAMQRVRTVAPVLGVDATHAHALASLYWREVYPEDLPDYRTPDCKPRSLLDLHPRDGVWP